MRYRLSLKPITLKLQFLVLLDDLVDVSKVFLQHCLNLQILTSDLLLGLSALRLQLSDDLVADYHIQHQALDHQCSEFGV